MLQLVDRVPVIRRRVCIPGGCTERRIHLPGIPAIIRAPKRRRTADVSAADECEPTVRGYDIEVAMY